MRDMSVDRTNTNSKWKYIDNQNANIFFLFFLTLILFRRQIFCSFQRCKLVKKKRKKKKRSFIFATKIFNELPQNEKIIIKI